MIEAILRLLADYRAGSRKAKRRELRAISSELAWLEAEYERLAQRRDELVNELRPALRVVSR
jgi:hypothetical protein